MAGKEGGKGREGSHSTRAWSSLGQSEATFDIEIESQPCNGAAAARAVMGSRKFYLIWIFENIGTWGDCPVLCTPVYSSPQIDIELL